VEDFFKKMSLTLAHISDLHFGREDHRLIDGLQQTLEEIEPQLIIIAHRPVSIVKEANKPKIRAQARPEKIGSRVIGQAPKAVVIAVNTIGRMQIAPLCRIASFTSIFSASESWINSIRTTEFLITIPPRAIMPIILVAVK